MNKKTIGVGALSLLLGISILANDASAFWGMRGGEEGREDFQSVRELFLNNGDYDSFQAAMQEHMGEWKTQRQGRRGEGRGFRDSMERTVENIDNGVIRTITSDNPEVVEHLQSRERQTPQRENVNRVIENITNGVQITITSDDPELVEHIQNQGEKGHGRRGGKRGSRGMGQMRGGMEQGQGSESGMRRGGRR